MVEYLPFLVPVIIIWMWMSILVSSVLCHIIVQFISKKPMVQMTLIDLIYKDCVCYLFLASLSFSLAVSSCLINFVSRYVFYGSKVVNQ